MAEWQSATIDTDGVNRDALLDSNPRPSIVNRGAFVEFEPSTFSHQSCEILYFEKKHLATLLLGILLLSCKAEPNGAIHF